MARHGSGPGRTRAHARCAADNATSRRDGLLVQLMKAPKLRRRPGALVGKPRIVRSDRQLGRLAVAQAGKAGSDERPSLLAAAQHDVAIDTFNRSIDGDGPSSTTNSPSAMSRSSGCSTGAPPPSPCVSVAFEHRVQQPAEGADKNQRRKRHALGRREKLYWGRSRLHYCKTTREPILFARGLRCDAQFVQAGRA